MNVICPKCGKSRVHLHYGKGGPVGWGCPDCNAEGVFKEREQEVKE